MSVEPHHLNFGFVRTPLWVANWMAGSCVVSPCTTLELEFLPGKIMHFQNALLA